MGGLHIEQAALVCIGQLITGSGMDDIVANASLDTIGLKTAVCDVNNIKKARYTLQVIIVALSKKLREAFESRCNHDQNMEEWVKSNKDCVMVSYWFNILRRIKVVLLIDHSEKRILIFSM